MSIVEAPRLGEVVTHDIYGVTIRFEAIVNALREAGLDTSYARKLTPKSAFSRACRTLRKTRAIDQLKEVSPYIQYQLTRKALSDAGVFDYTLDHIVTLDTENGSIRCDTSQEVADKAQQMLDSELGTRKSGDITKIVQKLFKDNGDLFPICPRKGVAYFVPDEHRDFTNKVEKFMTAVGGTLGRFPIMKGTEEGNRSVRECMDHGLNTMITELQEVADKFSVKTREKTIKENKEEWDRVTFKLRNYSSYLGGKVKELEDRMAEARQKVRERLAGIQAEIAASEKS